MPVIGANEEMKRRAFLQICGGIGGSALLLLTGCTRIDQEVDELPEIEASAEPTPTAIPDSIDATKEITTTPTAVKPIATLAVSATVDTSAGMEGVVKSTDSYLRSYMS
jgi:hypothetical protein